MLKVKYAIKINPEIILSSFLKNKIVFNSLKKIKGARPKMDWEQLPWTIKQGSEIITRTQPKNGRNNVSPEKRKEGSNKKSVIFSLGQTKYN